MRRSIATLLCTVFMILLCSCSKENNNIITPTETVITINSAEDNTIGMEETVPESLPAGIEKIDNISSNIQLSNSTQPTEATESSSTVNEDENDRENPGENSIQNPTSESNGEYEEDSTEADVQESECCEYAVYLNKSPHEQQEYMNTFNSPMAFIEWCKKVEAEHSAHVTMIEVSGSELDISDYIP